MILYLQTTNSNQPRIAALLLVLFIRPAICSNHLPAAAGASSRTAEEQKISGSTSPSVKPGENSDEEQQKPAQCRNFVQTHQ